MFLSALIKLKAVFLPGLHEQLAKGQCSEFGHFYLYEVLGKNVPAQWPGQELKAEHNTEVWWDGQVCIWIPTTHGVHLLCSQMRDCSLCGSIRARFDLGDRLSGAEWSSACLAEPAMGFGQYSAVFPGLMSLLLQGYFGHVHAAITPFVSSIHKLPLWWYG